MNIRNANAIFVAQKKKKSYRLLRELCSELSFDYPSTLLTSPEEELSMAGDFAEDTLLKNSSGSVEPVIQDKW